MDALVAAIVAEMEAHGEPIPCTPEGAKLMEGIMLRAISLVTKGYSMKILPQSHEDRAARKAPAVQLTILTPPSVPRDTIDHA